MTRFPRWLPALLVIGGLIAVPPASAEEGESEGEEPIFVTLKCNVCHSLEVAGIEAKTKSEKMKARDLTNVARERDADWLRAYLLREVTLDDEEHRKEFTGTEEQLDAVILWLGDQVTEEESATQE